MNRETVASESVASIGYEQQSATLEVEFVDGAVYQYFDVPEAEFEGIMSAGSVGGYLNTKIKGHYRYARV